VLLHDGARLGPYEITGCLGAGRMGEVYKAWDTRLERLVAIKIVAPTYVDNPIRIQHFAREARMLSHLTHPHICSLYDIGEHEGTVFLVMEYLPGETLAHRLVRGALSQGEALEIAVQLAGALDAAHRQGVIHRDLKPANIVLSPAGAKVVDFGLAAEERDPDDDSVGAGTPMAVVRTITRPAGMVGTLPYMAPEQINGHSDARSDLFALGAIIFEMVTGRRAFSGATDSAVIAEIESNQTPSMIALKPSTPTALDRAVRKCLAREPLKRWQTAVDLRDELEWIAHSVPRNRGGRTWLAGLLISSLAVVATTTLWRRPIAAPTATVGFTIDLEEKQLGLAPAIAISSDGQRIVFVMNEGTGSRLFVRNLGGAAWHAIDGTEGALQPFFSPDGQWIAFFVGGKLKTVPVVGGTPLAIADVQTPRGGTWLPDGTIIFAPSANSALLRVPATGGAPHPITKLDPTRDEGSHRWPHVLPDGKVLLFAAGPVVTNTNWSEAGIIAQSLLTGQRRVVADRGTYPFELPNGQVGFAFGNGIVGRAFDASRLEVSGAPVPLVADAVRGSTGALQVAVAQNGTIAYSPGVPPQRRPLVWVDRLGKSTPIPQPPATYSFPKLSPDGTRIVMNRADPESDVWVYDLTRGTSTRVTSNGGNVWPIWSGDGSSVTFASARGGHAELHSKPADGTGQEETITTTSSIQSPQSWSRDGALLAYTEVDSVTGSDIVVLARGLGMIPRPFVQTPFQEGSAVFSPDGHWVAYLSDETGVSEVYLRPYPGPGQRWQVTTAGGLEPLWSKHGHEIVFRRSNEVWAVDVKLDQHPIVGQPHRLFGGPYARPSTVRANYDVTSDGERFLMVPSDDPPRSVIEVITNWVATLPGGRTP
jgi:eukaryotic-like serine/threonine-protein kinase